MKKTLLLLLLTLSVRIAVAQIGDEYKYTIAVKGFSIMQMPKILSQKNAEHFTRMWFKGGMIKFNDNQFSYRISGNYLKRNTRLINNCSTCEEADGKVTDYVFKVGFEKNLSFSRFQPYFGFDLGYRFNMFEGEMISTNPLLANKAGANSYAVEATKSGLTVSPLLGFRLNPAKMVSVFAETNLDFFIFYERQELVSQDVNNTKTVNRYKKNEFLINPATVGIQIHLGNNR
ncbi:hypothetical protein [Pedobacter deserti]|uniref:hypothetical protein n=1 Tax=Pedobacter deserti TaxID=2817382 RepID=UPI00210C5EBD|nr:hypothetical protein [Pedobacter sp. SYSU D00382]